MKSKLTLLSLALFLLSNASFAKEHLFSANIIIDGQTVPFQTYDKVLDMAEQYTTANLKQIAPYYNAQSSVEAKVSYLGVDDILIRFDQNSTKLKLSIPSANIYREFDRNTRNESRKEMVDFLKSAPKQLTEVLVSSSYQHPVNEARVNTINAIHDVNSLITDNFVTNHPQLNSATMLNQSESLLVFAPRFGHYTQGDLETDVVTLPLAYAKWLPNQNFTLVLDMPVTVSQTEKAISGQGSVGVGIISAINDQWSLMPQMRVGAVIAPDFGASALLLSSSLTSNYKFNLSEATQFGLINILSYYQTSSLKIKSYKSEYDLTNFVFRNGLELSQKLNYHVWGQPVILKAHAARTDYTGDAVYSKYSHDVGASIGFNSPLKSKFMKELRVGFNYNQAEHDVKGFSLNAGYAF